MIYLYLFGTCFHFIYVFMIIGNDSIQFWIYTPWSDDKGIHFVLPVEQK